MNTIISLTNKHLNSNIAWFRLHEAALKNEHERAFLNYKLLMYSYGDKGFQLQVQGELHLLFFENELAIKAFQEAFLIYFYSQNYIQAILLYFKIVELNGILPSQAIELREIIKQENYILFQDQV